MFGLLGSISERDFWQTCWGGFDVRLFLLVSPTDINEAVQEQLGWESQLFSQNKLSQEMDTLSR